MLAVLTVGLLVVLPHPGAARASAPCPCLALHLPDGSVTTLTADQIESGADVHDTQYETRAVAGGTESDEPYVSSGLSVHAVLAALTPPVDPATVSFTETARPDGSWATLSTADLSAAPDFTDARLPVVHLDGPVLEYVRPLHDDPDDVNIVDLLRSSTIDLYVHTGPMLRVTAMATPLVATAGQTVSFTAVSTGTSSPVTYSWAFGDAAAASGTTTDHAYPTDGSYVVRVTATGSDGSAGQSEALVVRVGPVASAVSASAPGPSRTVRSKHPTSTSPHRSPSPRPVPATRPAAPSPATSVSRPSAAPAPSPSVDVSMRAAPSSAGPTSVSPPVPTVTGRLLGGAVTTTTTPRPTLAATAGASSTGGPGPLPATGGAAIVVGLLALGATRELRRGRR